MILGREWTIQVGLARCEGRRTARGARCGELAQDSPLQGSLHCAQCVTCSGKLRQHQT